MFKLIPIGTNGLYPTDNKPTSCYLINVSDKNIVIDMGSGCFDSLRRYVAPENVDLVVISHFHSDHCADLGVFGYYMEAFNKKVRVICPKDEHANAFFNTEKFFDVTFMSEHSIDFFGIKMQFLKMNHPVETYSVSIAAEGRVFTYTSDTNVCEALDLCFKGSDLVVCDSAFMYKNWSESKPHISARHCGEYSKKYGVKTLLSHFNPKADLDALLSEAREVSDLCRLIENGKTYIV